MEFRSIRLPVLTAVIISVASVHAESSRIGALGRNDTVVTKEADPVASAAIASEVSARQAAVTELTDQINAESSIRKQAVETVEAQLEALKTQKQDAVVTLSSTWAIRTPPAHWTICPISRG